MTESQTFGASDAGTQTKPAHSILVVDDEPGAREALRLILEPRFRVLIADKGETALEILRQEAVSVITLDLRMPGLSGQETLLQIREINSEVEVVIVTGYGSYPETMSALRLRAFELVCKPFDANQVREAVHRALARREKRLQGTSHEVHDGLAKRLRESLRGLSASEERSLSESGEMKLDRLRERARLLLKDLARDDV